jgi:hypothetical protein
MRVSKKVKDLLVKLESELVKSNPDKRVYIEVHINGDWIMRSKDDQGNGEIKPHK